MRFPTEITFRGFEPSESVEDKVRRWAEKLDTVYDRIQRCEVVIEAPHRHHRHGRQFHVRITLSLPGDRLVVSRDPGQNETHEDVYVAIRDAFQAARRRVEDWVRRRVHRAVQVHEASPARITSLDAEKAWGYLEPEDGRRIYFHRNSVRGDADGLEVGDEVRFAEEPGEAGPQATSVVPLGAHAHHELSPAVPPVRPPTEEGV